MFQSWWSLRFTWCFPFWSLILSNTFMCNFLLAFWLATLFSMFSAIYLVLGLICFCIFKSSFLVCLNSVFGFYLVNSGCGSYLAVDHSLVYTSYPKTFLLFFSIILSAIIEISSFKTIFLDSFLGFFFVLFFAHESTGIL